MGEVTAIAPSLTEVRGYTFLFQPGADENRRLPEERTRLFSLGESGHVVNKIPKDVDVNAIVYKTIGDRLVVTDGRSFSLPINEFGVTRWPCRLAQGIPEENGTCSGLHPTELRTGRRATTGCAVETEPLTASCSNFEAS